MMVNPITNLCLPFVLLCGALSTLFAQKAGEALRIQGAITEDVYAAGGMVRCCYSRSCCWVRAH